MKYLIPIVFAAVGLQSCTQPVDELPGAGRWRVINYWAIWCAPCREEIPELNALDDRTDLMVFAVNYDGQNGEALQSQAAEMGITFTLLEQDPGGALGVERPRVLPTTLLVNPKGAVTDTLVGPQTQESLLAVWRGRTAR
jgi:thiol-disulfide isomerase/thioredoxin